MRVERLEGSLLARCRVHDASTPNAVGSQCRSKTIESERGPSHSGLKNFAVTVGKHTQVFLIHTAICIIMRVEYDLFVQALNKSGNFPLRMTSLTNIYLRSEPGLLTTTCPITETRRKH
jgi:hypothetical protein